MNTFPIVQTPARAAILVFTLFATSWGFGAGWYAHRAITLVPWTPRPVWVASAVPRPPTLVVVPPREPTPVCTHDLAEDQEDCPGASRAILRAAPYHYLLDRRVFTCLLNPPQDRVVPNLRVFQSTMNGQAVGFKIYAVRPGNLFARLGFQNGDMVYAVNGMSIATPDLVIKAYPRLRTASRFAVELLRPSPRGGQSKLTLTYHLFDGSQAPQRLSPREAPAGQSARGAAGQNKNTPVLLSSAVVL